MNGLMRVGMRHLRPLCLASGVFWAAPVDLRTGSSAVTLNLTLLAVHPLYRCLRHTIPAVILLAGWHWAEVTNPGWQINFSAAHPHSG